MPLSIDELLEGARTLPADQRLSLADLIYDTVEADELPGAQTELHPDWYPELERRSEEIRSGKVKAIPAEEVFAEIDRLIEAL